MLMVQCTAPFEFSQSRRIECGNQKHGLPCSTMTALLRPPGEEEAFVQFFASQRMDGSTEDIIELDVAGKRMAVKRSTLRLCEDSVLSRQFDESVWTHQRGGGSGGGGGGGGGGDSDDSDDSDGDA